MESHSLEQFKKDLSGLGICTGDTVMMHSSYKSLGGIENGPMGLFSAFMELLGENGTLILPAFSYDTVGRGQPVFDREATPSCVGFLPEYFRTEVEGVVRSFHATHSCSVKGKKADELIAEHELDLTPVGIRSPIAKLPNLDGKILFLGCNSDHNTAIHGVEELIKPIYLFEEEPIHYILKDGEREIEQTAIHHSFFKDGLFYDQKYSRIVDLLPDESKSHGKVLDADCLLLSAKAVWEMGRKKMAENPLYFVDITSVIEE